MEPPGGSIPPDRDKFPVAHQQPNTATVAAAATTVTTATVVAGTIAATTTVSATSSTQHSSALQQQSHHYQSPQQSQQNQTALHQPQQHSTAQLQTSHQYFQQQHNTSLIGVSTSAQQALDRLLRPMSFDKMEALVREMQDPENGVPVRQQKMFLTSIPYAFMGYDLIEWLMDRLSIEESEALSIANQLCLHGYFFPVNDTKTLTVKDDSSLYRFQTPYYWPWQHKAPDNVEYAIYLAKRSLRNKQRHGLEDYESDALASLHKNLKGKWDFISMQAEEQVRLAKERKKGDKIVGDSQERAYWRVHRPPPNQFTPLEPCPVPSRDRQGAKPKKRTVEDWQREVGYLKKSLARTRMKMSQACESLCNYWETFADYDFFLHPALPSNPWVSEDTTFWQLNSAIVDLPTEKRIKRWAISVEELVSDPTGIQEFTTFLEKEYSHENIRFWIAVNKLRRSAHSQVAKKVNEIYEEFLKPGAPCEINIDGKTMEVVQKGLKQPSRFTFDAAAEHIYMLLLKKDCYPRFIRSDHYKTLLERGIQPAHKKRFFGFGGVAKKKSSTVAPPNQVLLAQTPGITTGPQSGTLTRRRGSDRSLTGSAHELAITSVKEVSNKVPHSHSQNNLNETQYREAAVARAAARTERLETSVELAGGASAVCPWDAPQSSVESAVVLSVCPWDETQSPIKSVEPKNTNIGTDISEVSERMRRSCGLRQNTVDSDYSTKRLIPHITEQRRASMTMAPRISDFQFTRPQITSTIPSPHLEDRSLQQHQSSMSAAKTISIEVQDVPSAMITSLAITEEPASTTIDDPSEQQQQLPIQVFHNEEEKIQKDMKKCTSVGDLKFQEIPCTTSATGTISTATTTIATSTNVRENTMNCITTSKIAESDNNNLTPIIVAMQSDNISGASPSSIAAGPPIIQVCSVADTDTSITVTVAIIEERRIEIEQNVVDSSVIDVKPAAHQQTQLSLGLEECRIGVTGEDSAQLEELSPTTEEYHEAQFGEQIDDYSYTIEDVEVNLTPGCVAPAPTPAPSLAPLAEIEPDQVDEEPECSSNSAIVEEQAASATVKVEAEEPRKRRKKRESNAKKLEVKEEAGLTATVAAAATTTKEGEADRNTVCPWEDENLTTASDGTFVKTYATLGYL